MWLVSSRALSSAQNDVVDRNQQTQFLSSMIGRIVLVLPRLTDCSGPLEAKLVPPPVGQRFVLGEPFISNLIGVGHMPRHFNVRTRQTDIMIRELVDFFGLADPVVVHIFPQ